MAQFIEKPTLVQAAGNKPKVIEEYIGRVNSQTTTKRGAHGKPRRLERTPPGAALQGVHACA